MKLAQSEITINQRPAPKVNRYSISIHTFISQPEFQPIMTSILSATNASESEGNGAGKKKKGVFKALKFELQQVKNRWNEEIKLMWTRPPPPWPVRTLRIIPQPKDAEIYDVEELRVRLIINGPDMEQFPLDVEVPQKSLPKKLQSAISETIKKYWKEELAAELSLPEHLRSGWQLEKVFAYAEKSYGSFLRLVPELLEAYFGTNSDGVTIRRFAIVEPVKVDLEAERQKMEEANKKNERPKTAAEIKAIEDGKRLAAERDRQRRIEAARKLEQMKLEAERKKTEAMAARERGDYVPPPKKLSKAELKAQAEYKAKHKRMAKTGPAKKKYDGEGSAVQKAKKGGGKKKKKS